MPPPNITYGANRDWSTGSQYLMPATPNVTGCFTRYVPPPALVLMSAAIDCARELSAPGVVSRTYPPSTNTCRPGRTLTPISPPNDWLVTLPNADCATPSMYPRESSAAVGDCAAATPPSAAHTRTAYLMCLIRPSRRRPRCCW